MPDGHPALRARPPPPASRCGASSSWRRAGTTVPAGRHHRHRRQDDGHRRWSTDMLRASGVRAVAAGNNELPLVDGHRRPGLDVFVVEASSFRLAAHRALPPRGRRLAEPGRRPPRLARARWTHYAAAKARIWAAQRRRRRRRRQRRRPGGHGHVRRRRRPASMTFGLGGRRLARAEGGRCVRPGRRRRCVAVDELPGARCPHDLANALAAAAAALGGGATLDGVRDGAARVPGAPPPRRAGRRSMAACGGTTTRRRPTPHAAVAARRGVRLGRADRRRPQQGPRPLGARRRGADRVRAVVAIGEAAAEVAAAFDGVRPVVDGGVDGRRRRRGRRARRARRRRAAVAGLRSFDWYRSYGERGDDFARAVRAELGRR